MAKVMKAYVIEESGGAEKLLLREIPVPSPKPGWVLIRIKAFGLNRSEWFTRRGDSPSVKFPRVLGIECVGEVVEHDTSYLKKGQKIAAVMGGMGRDFDGSYAEYTLVPKENVFSLHSALSWEALAALPEMLQTTHGSLFQALEIESAKNILIRGGTSSIGLCALAIAKSRGLEVTVTTRSGHKVSEMKELGADHVIVDEGKIEKLALKIHSSGYDRVLDLIGTSSLIDSMRSLRRGGIACMTGILGGEWELKNFRPMEDIPTAVKLTSYSGEAADISSQELSSYVALVEKGQLTIKTGKVFPFLELQKAHELMDTNGAGGKMVITHS